MTKSSPDSDPAACPPRPAGQDGPSDGADWLKRREDGIVIPSFDFRVDFAAASATGVGRDHNEDALLCRAERGLFAIADGMGGHAAGEVAAQVSLDVVERELCSAEARKLIGSYASDPEIENRRALFDLLERALGAANDAVIQAGRREASRKGMGTTLDLALLVRDRAFFAHVGDSRAYLVRPTATLQLTHDHAAYDTLRTSGKRTPAPRFSRSPLTNSIGHRRRLVVDTLFVDLATSDRIILCTDGVFNPLEGESDFARLVRSGDPEQVCGTMIGSARGHGEQDDASIIALTVKKRFAKRRGDAGPRARDLATVSSSPLLIDLPPAHVLSALAAGVEVELKEGSEVPRAVASDRVAYIILDGMVELPSGRTLGASGLLMVESLLDLVVRGTLPKVVERTRLLRIRHDDFTEVCAHNMQLAAELYRRIATHLATAGPTGA
ncbi:MAG: protein phosphatase 2C domain-containing protein [Deltaproteobacteria bacterium]|nr:protein phosphatase 2C domain-containing protein [Deltaproteobacteria bacterium]